MPERAAHGYVQRTGVFSGAAPKKLSVRPMPFSPDPNVARCHCGSVEIFLESPDSRLSASSRRAGERFGDGWDEAWIRIVPECIVRLGH